ncbi:12864_t:CDS:1, partial [Acaulospora morrowiae]
MSNNDCDVPIDIDAEEYQQSDAEDNVNPQNRMFISTMEYYAYQIQIRPNNINLILRDGRLFQQYVVD